jgi:hypothetical protein
MTKKRKLVAERTASTYAIAITPRQMLKMLATESDWAQDVDRNLYDDTLWGKLLEVTGVDDVEYSGHFGEFVHFKVEAEHDTPDTHKKVVEVILEHLSATLADKV